jgi:hypothetical protein
MCLTPANGLFGSLQGSHHAWRPEAETALYASPTRGHSSGCRAGPRRDRALTDRGPGASPAGRRRSARGGPLQGGGRPGGARSGRAPTSPRVEGEAAEILREHGGWPPCSGIRPLDTVSLPGAGPGTRRAWDKTSAPMTARSSKGVIPGVAGPTLGIAQRIKSPIDRVSGSLRSALGPARSLPRRHRRRPGGRRGCATTESAGSLHERSSST